MKKVFFAVVLLTSFAFSCEKQDNTVTMTYHMTQCADVWMGSEYSKDKEGTLKKFLTEKNIQVMSLKITTDCGSGAVCQACTCLGCDIATVEVPEEDVAEMEALKFVKK